MKNKATHPNADLIYQWSQDTTIKISRMNPGRAEKKWLSFDPHTSGWHTSYIYRLDDDNDEESKIVSSLTLKEMHELFFMGTDGSKCCGFTAVANAAAQRAIDDLKAGEFLSTTTASQPKRSKL